MTDDSGLCPPHHNPIVSDDDVLLSGFRLLVLQTPFCVVGEFGIHMMESPQTSYL